jgi:hypothetical protein
MELCSAGTRRAIHSRRKLAEIRRPAPVSSARAQRAAQRLHSPISCRNEARRGRARAWGRPRGRRRQDLSAPHLRLLCPPRTREWGQPDNLEKVGRPAGAYVTEYGYRDPVYEGRERSFRGFREATVRVLGDVTSAGIRARLRLEGGF